MFVSLHPIKEVRLYYLAGEPSSQVLVAYAFTVSFLVLLQRSVLRQEDGGVLHLRASQSGPGLGVVPKWSVLIT